MCMRPTYLKQGKNIVWADGPAFAFGRGDGGYLCCAGGETRTSRLYFDLREAQRFRQEGWGSVLYLC